SAMRFTLASFFSAKLSNPARFERRWCKRETGRNARSYAAMLDCTAAWATARVAAEMETFMQLYEFGPARSIRVRWTLQELGIDFEPITVDLRAGDHRRPEFLKINPAGKIPVLIDGDVVLTESVAIVLYLSEKYASKGLLPADLAHRAEVHRWLL